jgi:LPS sulfotransferase NodH
VIFVIGFAHSGTTFLCEVLGGAGMTFSDPMDHMEDVPLRRLLFDVDERLLRHSNRADACADFHEPIREAFGRFPDAQVVKQPSFVHCLRVVLEAGIRPDQALLTYRDLVLVKESLVGYGRYEKRRASSLRIEWMQKEWATAKQTLEEEGIPFGIVRFPRSVDDPDEIPLALQKAIGSPPPPQLRQALEEAWEKWRNPKRVHYERG